ncbi:MAG: hypothetical protein GY816_08800, partial [Cytophagales bacterium]|nr:hypothetical protein [Cytophagales bacterium]
MKTPRNFLQSLVQTRAMLNEKRLTKKNLVKCIQIVKKAKQWLEFYNPTDQQALKYIIRNQADIEYILPGEGAKSSKS